MKRLLVSLVFALTFSTATACGGVQVAAPPDSVSAQAKVAFRATQVIQSLDQLRDFAINANALNPPLVSESATRQIVRWHSVAITTVHTAPIGWRATVRIGLNSLVANLSAKDAKAVAPYVQLSLAVLQEVQ